jgi:hypothetical protein
MVVTNFSKDGAHEKRLAAMTAAEKNPALHKASSQIQDIL